MINPPIAVSISGKGKSGKSTLAYSFPDPIKEFNFDISPDFVRSKFPEKKIDVAKYPIPLLETAKGTGAQQKEIADLFEQFDKDFKGATEADYKTLIIDPWPMLYAISRIWWAKKLGVQAIPQTQYADLYAKLKSYIHRTRFSGQNLILITYIREILEGDGVFLKGTGEYEADGPSWTTNEVDIVLWTRLDSKVTAKGKTNLIKTTIYGNRFSLDLYGMELENTDYNELIALITS